MIKLRNVITSLLLLFSLLPSLLPADELNQVDIAQLIDLRDQQNALIIDIRTPQEWAASGLIPQSYPLTFFDADGRFDIDQWQAKLAKLRTTPDQAVVLVCKSGNRSAKAGQILTQTQQMKNLYHLQKGIVGWVTAGNPVARNCPNQLACR
ncbi:MAG: rhodanese-like domain-containing protein [Methylicorpusculum sp.]|uniref:rhodanese-like domain-containing protein n=1 Tax=Methylicorpusculum sp. TaxID=2713644 RepID=UPI00271B57B8|nr:rhodanese-like domain-containing protein [Methylicorpusculum sp.]MDO8938342.1 rhodanese-like domain-containing protein [Methylicorpusculum sp.]MDO9240202.1 rhodanese-like domain-containing protein [Methylicorpusculum sp.]MDP2200395.1 rhodanese-like domain-containing protein [Methylicorpusculum sp.]